MSIVTTLAGTAVAAGAALSSYAYYVEPRWFELRHHVIRPVRRPPRPFRILQVSDTHFTETHHWKERYLASLAAHPVDFVLLLGDLIETSGGIDRLLEAVRALRPRYGTYAVLGAHDCLFPGPRAILHDVLLGGRHHSLHVDAKRLIHGLWDAGVHIFRNDGVVLEPGERSPFPEPVFLCGINDAFSGWDNVERAVRGRPAGMYSMLLAHALHEYHDVLDAAPDLCFFGHAHGGQVRIPGVGALLSRSSLPTKFARGEFRQGHTTFHLNHGLGSGRWTPWRFNCRPQATLVEVV